MIMLMISIVALSNCECAKDCIDEFGILELSTVCVGLQNRDSRFSCCGNRIASVNFF